MKRTNYIRHLTVYLFILIIFLCSFLYPFPSDIDQAAETSFSFEVTNPTVNENFKNKNLQFSGTYTLDTNTDPNAKLSVTITDTTDPTNPVVIPSDTMIISDNAWSFSKDFTDGH
ncbi:hypothetical protein [Neobacillus sp. PS3-40]|uniref:hypothetical protein n=1 Tax=Neobacillus sp. PS3-40 TaxID=3070679 RepID=UPI0027E20968|nr:hypothetical protein [Neobacillus sp. PS3-40]WML46061.1 hypothetical protein RCG20_09315 [Neobacillus sp. PS3-40]